jgi:hypothetical protein
MTDPASTSSGPAPLSHPGLTWGVKRSFVRYLSLLPDFRHAETDGAFLVSGSFFHFPHADDDAVPATGVGAAGPMRFRGEVRLTGHRGMLAVVIADPWVELRDGRTVLTVVDHRPDGAGRMPIALLRPTASVTGTFRRWTASLTDEARWLFDDQYPPGEELDPVEVGLPA